MNQLPRLMSKLLSRPGFRYLVVGAISYLLEVLVIIISQRAGASPVTAVTLSFWIGLVISFFLQKLFAFKDKRMHRRVVIRQILLVTALVSFNYGFTSIIIRLLVGHSPTVISRTIALLITTVWNFYLYRTRIFKSTDALIVG
jgi:putative flippase GtrA